MRLIDGLVNDSEQAVRVVPGSYAPDLMFGNDSDLPAHNLPVGNNRPPPCNRMPDQKVLSLATTLAGKSFWIRCMPDWRPQTVPQVHQVPQVSFIL